MYSCYQFDFIGSIHQLSLNERYSKLDRVAAEAKKEYKTHQEHVYEDNNKVRVKGIWTVDLA